MRDPYLGSHRSIGQRGRGPWPIAQPGGGGGIGRLSGISPGCGPFAVGEKFGLPEVCPIMGSPCLMKMGVRLFGSELAESCVGGSRHHVRGAAADGVGGVAQ